MGCFDTGPSGREEAVYTIMSIPDTCPIFIEARVLETAELTVMQGELMITALTLKAGTIERTFAGNMKAADESRVKIIVTKGRLELNALCFGDIREEIYNGFWRQ